MVNENASVSARALLGEPVCQLMLRPVGEIPGGLWSWRVYVDGNVQSRGPGSKRRDSVHWYATLLSGPHCIVVRDAEINSPSRWESNMLQFTVNGQTEVLIDVLLANGELRLELSQNSLQGMDGIAESLDRRTGPQS